MVQVRNLSVQADGSRRRNAVGATLRYRNLLVRQMVQMKIKISTLPIEAGLSYNEQGLHQAGLFPRTSGHEPTYQ